MTLKKPTIVILDMDGTTVRHLNPRLLHILEKLDDAFYSTRLALSKLGEFLKLETFLPRPHRQTRKPPRLIAHRVLHKIRRKRVEQIVEPCPGMMDLLDLFKAHNIPLALVSNGLGKGYGDEVLAAFDLAPYFSAMVFREDIHKSKPDPEAILTVLARLPRAATKDDVIWYIGDRHKDIRAALAAAKQIPCEMIPIGYGLHAAVAVLEHSLPAENLILSYEEWFGSVNDVLGPLAPIVSTRLPPVSPKSAQTTPRAA